MSWLFILKIECHADTLIIRNCAKSFLFHKNRTVVANVLLFSVLKEPLSEDLFTNYFLLHHLKEEAHKLYSNINLYIESW